MYRGPRVRGHGDGVLKPPKRGKSGKKSASAGWDRELVAAPANDESWKSLVIVTTGTGEVATEFLNKGATDAGKGRRAKFKALTLDTLMAWAKEVSKAKGKSKDPLEGVIQEACALLVDCGDAPSATLLARLVKAKVLEVRAADLEARAEREAAEAAEREAEALAAAGGPPPTASGKRGKSAKGKKGKGGAPAADGPGKKKSKMVTRDKEMPDTVDDEPEGGPDCYFYVQGIDDPAFLKALSDSKSPAAIVIKASAQADADAAAAAAKDAADEAAAAAATAAENPDSAPPAQGTPELAPEVSYRERAQVDVDASSPDSELRAIAWSSMELGIKGAIEPEEIFDTVAAETFRVVAMKEKYLAYKESLHVMEIPEAAPAKEVNMDHYNAILDTVPTDCISAAIVLDCLLEQAEVTDVVPPAELAPQSEEDKKDSEEPRVDASA
eukprot:gene20453-21055_t